MVGGGRNGFVWIALAFATPRNDDFFGLLWRFAKIALAMTQMFLAFCKGYHKLAAFA